MLRSLGLAALDAADERYTVHDRLEILAALRGVMAARKPVFVYWDDSDCGAMTVLLGTDHQDGLYLDCLVDPASTRAMIRSGVFRLVAQPGGVKLEFEFEGAEAALWEGRPALRAPMPVLMYRLQRREDFRVPVALRCQVAIDEGERVRMIEPRIADLSLGGIAMVLDRIPAGMEIGRLLSPGRIALGRLGTLVTTLEVRGITELRAAGGAKQVRMGCRFVELPRGADQLLSRYIAELQRNRKI